MTKRERVNGVELAFDDRGEGDAVILLHPFPFDRRAWAGTLPALVAAGRRVIALDIPGFGDSPLPAEAAHAGLSIAAVADLVAGVMDQLAIAKAALVGLSMGGYVALAFAARFGHRLTALGLADTRASADSAAARQGRADALATIRDRGVDAYLDQSLPKLIAPGAASELLAVVRSLAERRPDTLTAGLIALRDRPDRTIDLGRITCPTLVMVGAVDQVTPPAEMRGMAAAIRGARVVELDGAGHLSNLEAPAAFNRALLEFLREPAPVAGATSTRGVRT